MCWLCDMIRPGDTPPFECLPLPGDRFVLPDGTLIRPKEEEWPGDRWPKWSEDKDLFEILPECPADVFRQDVSWRKFQDILKNPAWGHENRFSFLVKNWNSRHDALCCLGLHAEYRLETLRDFYILRLDITPVWAPVFVNGWHDEMCRRSRFQEKFGFDPTEKIRIEFRHYHKFCGNPSAKNLWKALYDFKKSPERKVTNSVLNRDFGEIKAEVNEIVRR